MTTLNSASVEDATAGSGRIDLSGAKELIGIITSFAGKSKDEMVQILCREIGTALAAVLKEPLTQVLENRKLQITLELVPKGQAAPKSKKPKARGKS